MVAPWGPRPTKLLRFSFSRRLLVDPLLPGQTVANHFGALFVVLDALLFVDFLSSSFDISFYLLSEPLGVDFELPN